jgi:pentafunctional AROM polypeptide
MHAASNVQVIEGKETIIVGHGIIAQGFVAQDLKTRVPRVSKHVIVTDSTVHRLHGSAIYASFQAAGIQPLVKVIPPGEETKCRETKEEIEDWMLARACNRDTCIVR